jgi:hypothetical protein
LINKKSFSSAKLDEDVAVSEVKKETRSSLADLKKEVDPDFV